VYRIPLATYRLQFNANFTYQHAREIVEYLAALGITDIYSSPLLRARKGSTHGYDTVDAMSLNPELGTIDDLTELRGALDRRNMGLLVDIVPNHMAASHENAWWMSVLENGPHSRFLHYFDIDWRDNKVLLPILGHPYGETLEAGELRLGFDADGFFITYWDKRLPVAPQSYPLVLRDCAGSAPEVRDLVASGEEIANSRFVKDTLWRLYEQSAAFREALQSVIERTNHDFNLLDQLLDAQWYRLAYWRIASETINYRRFFDVTDLVGVRVENPEVFALRNRLMLDLIADGKLTGIRIDHIDGLYDPAKYLAKLGSELRFSVSTQPVVNFTAFDEKSTALDEISTARGEKSNARGESEKRSSDPNFYVVVEKVLAPGETLPPFRCAGTTGYDFLDIVNAVFVDPAGLASLTDFYRAHTGITSSFEDVVYERKKQVIDQLFYGEMRALGTHLGALAVADRNARDFAPSELLAALIEITACMPVYRTYIREAPVSESDRAVLVRAMAEARRRAQEVDERLFRFLELVLLLEPPAYIASEQGKWLDFVMRWQQFTGRVMAKGVEDTAFYNYNRLISLNDVGGDPGRAGDFDPVAEFHARNERILRDWPDTMNATSTHDTKRAEDVRARIDVLSEIAEEWSREVRKWTRITKHPDANVALFVYQTLIGMWPLDPSEMPTVPERLRAYLVKAAREAKTHTNWHSPNVEYEESLQNFATAILEDQRFVDAFRRFHRRIAFHGFLNSLAQVVLKVCSPGAPDFYQGTELWDFSLVDPDNRRPVDYEKRMAMLAKLPAISTLLRQWKDGRIKLFVTARSLATRARHAETFQRGAYRPIDTGTPNAIAFTRGENILVVLPRLTMRLVKPPRLPIGEVWGDRALPLEGRWRNVFTDEVIDDLALRNVFASFPVAILERSRGF